MPNLESARHPTFPMIQTARVNGKHACLFRLLLRCSSCLDRASYFDSKIARDLHVKKMCARGINKSQRLPAATIGLANSFSERAVQEI